MGPLLAVHVVISLVALVAGFVVAYGFWTARRMSGWAALFLSTTVVTCLTGFPLPADRVLPSHIVGVLTLVALAVAIHALYRRRLAGGSRRAYVIASLVALYFNAFVTIVQAFLKIPGLHALAPTQSEPPFLVAQLALLGLMGILGWFGVRSFHPVVGRA